MKKLFEAMIAIAFVFTLVAATTVVSRADIRAEQGAVAIVQTKSFTVALKSDVQPAPYATTNRSGPVVRSPTAVKGAVPSISARPKEQPNINPYSGLPPQHFARADPAAS